MGDWKHVVKGEDYAGPTAQTIYDHITMFGTRNGCTLSELERQFGPNRTGDSSLTNRLDALVRKGQIEIMELSSGKWAKKKG